MSGFDSRLGLNKQLKYGIFLGRRGDGMVDSGDLKSPGRNAVWVRLPLPVPPQDMNLRTTARTLRKRFEKHNPLITVSLSRDNLLHNLATYQKAYPHLSFAPVLKSNAYGHGLTVIAELLDKEKIAFFMVDSFYEARTLRRAGVKSRIAIIGYMQPEEIALSMLPKVDYAIVDIEQLRDLAKIAKKKIRLHLKIDTGMHRQGLLPQDLTTAIKLIRSNPKLEVVGVGSHFADADNPDSDLFSRKQMSVWKEALKDLLAAFPTIKYRHIAATKGMVFSKEAETNVGRLGIGLYGFDTAPHPSHSAAENRDLKPVMEMRSLISSLRVLPNGESVGYNATYTTSKPTTIATVPVGYFEGVDRALSSKGVMQVRGQACPLTGRVSMNMSSIDVSAVPDVQRGDSVTVISRNSTELNSVEQMANVAGTSPYVILVHIPQHLKRVVE